MVPDAAHAASEPGIAAALRAATDRFAADAHDEHDDAAVEDAHDEHNDVTGAVEGAGEASVASDIDTTEPARESGAA
jgi:hypothetical protein